MDSVSKKAVQTTYIPGFSTEKTALAYVKPITTDKGSGFAIYAADGTELAIYNSREVAVIAAKQHDLEPVSIN